jgi:hypothetical protein
MSSCGERREEKRMKSHGFLEESTDQGRGMGLASDNAK